MKAPETESRKYWMGVLARAGSSPLEQAWEGLPEKPDYDFLRAPEVGMTMVRGRAGGTGQQFNLGEMTMTRCSVKLQGASETVGHGYVAGRDKRHAELAAVFDALLQTPETGSGLLENFIDPLFRAQARRTREKAEKTAATRVSFFTMVRGED